VALEDSANGLKAAGGAGIRGIAVGHRLPRGDWVGSATFVSSLQHTHELLEIFDLTGRNK
jgi:beta-phosphoglucomutase-like phosphatase (HAD superfamily)